MGMVIYMIDFTFLSSNEVFGPKRLPMFKNNCGAEPTDLALLLCEGTLDEHPKSR